MTRGGDGDDTYFVDNTRDRVLEASATGGFDTVNSSATLGLKRNVEVLNLTGTDNLNAYGNGEDNWLNGNDGDNLLRGNGGADIMNGGAGDDLYLVADSDDQAIEDDVDGGFDVVKASASFTLGANVEVLALVGNGAIDGTGNDQRNWMYGNGQANSFSGGGSKDKLFGYGGDDTLTGGDGFDDLTGGTGSDRFVFDTALSASNIDTIRDMVAGEDVIVLDQDIFATLGTGVLAGTAFRAGTAALDGDDRIVYDAATGQIFYDADGNGGAAQVLFATVTAGTALTADDFLVI